MSAKTLPKKLVTTLKEIDLEFAVCGSPTRCAEANCLRRMYPEATFVKVNPNIATITYHAIIYHYSIPNTLLKIVQMNDDGSLQLNKDIKPRVTLMFLDCHPVKTEESRQKDLEYKKAKRQCEVDQGIPKKRYVNTRLLAARAAGKATARNRKPLVTPVNAPPHSNEELPYIAIDTEI